jgi:hypothetical protein
MKGAGIFLMSFIINLACFAQVESFSIDKDVFLKPSIQSIGYLMENVDTNKYKEVLYPLKFESIPANQRAHGLEYKKSVADRSQYIAFDERYGVLTIIWKDITGKHYISKELLKSLKGKDYNAPGYYKIQYKSMDLVIGVETIKDHGLNEMITVEIERK